MKINHSRALRRTIIATLCFTAVSIVSARQLSPEEAFHNATVGSQMQSTMGVGNKGLDLKEVSVLDTRSVGDINALYVMRGVEPDKILVISADDVARPLLGWFDAGADFTATDINPTLQWWLDVYAAEIAAAVEAGVEPVAQTTTAATLKDVAPLISTRWDQGSPYNALCPTIGGRATYTGCVATAMAQIVNYHRWPERCSGSVEYKWSNGDQTLSLDMSTIAPDWDNMVDVYTSSATEAQQYAVAELMKACGYSVRMSYGTSGSGAYSPDVVTGLIDNFGYAKSIEYLDRDLFGYNEWVGILYNELACNRPVYYSGRDTGGHAFVIDGFRSTDYFHVNWGWGGMSDGYFVITALDPDSQGIGGSTSGYNYDQAAVIGIQKEYPGSVAPVSLYLNGDFSTYAESYPRTGSVRFLGSKSYLINGGSTTLEELCAGIRLTDLDSGEEQTLFQTTSYTLESNYGLSTYLIPASQFPASGRYRVEPIARVGQEIMSVRVPVGACNALMLTADADILMFEPIANDASIRVGELRSLTRVYEGKTLSLEATVEGLSGEYYGTLTPKIYHGTYLLATGAAMFVDVPAGTSRQVQWSVDVSELAVGEYQVYIADENDNNIGGPLGIEICAVPEGTPSLSVTAMKCEAAAGEGTWQSPWKVAPYNISFTAVITNASGLFDNYVYAFLFPSQGGNSLAMLGNKALVLGPGESGQWILDTEVSALEPGSDYFIVLYYRDGNSLKAMGNYYYLSPDVTASISDVASDCTALMVDPVFSTVTLSNHTGMVKSISAYSATGVWLASIDCADNPAPSLILPRGVALLHITLASGEVVVKKVVIP